jgi:hypothetical protein
MLIGGVKQSQCFERNVGQEECFETPVKRHVRVNPHEKLKLEMFK